VGGELTSLGRLARGLNISNRRPLKSAVQLSQINYAPQIKLGGRLMRKAYAIVLAGLGAVTLTGAAVAASRDTHTMTVPLPDGSTASIEYIGSVAPKVTLNPAPLSVAFPSFGTLDRNFAEMRRQIDAMMREMNSVAAHPLAGAPGMNVAAYANAPAGTKSVTVVSTSNGSKTCTRTTEVTSQDAGKPPKVVTNVSGDCPKTSAPPLVGNPA
jgi:hypothetical protein